MLLTYINIAWRRITRDKVYSLIVVFGLSISLAVCMLVVQYSRYELHYETFFKNASRIYRVTTESYDDKRLVYRSALSSRQIAQGLKSDLPEVTEVTQLQETNGWFTCTLKYSEGSTVKIFNEQNVFYSGSSFFKVFSWPLNSGVAATALDRPFSVVITESTARRYFGKESALGKTLHLKGSFDENDYTVTGVMPDLPEDSHMKINVLFSERSLEHNRFANSFDGYTYLLTSENIKSEALNEKIPILTSKLFGSKASDIGIIAQPIKDIHFDQRWQDEMKTPGSKRAIYFLLIVAAFILLIALINYINLATSRALQRAREVGVRKVSGAQRSQLIRQFLTESLLIYGFSLMITWAIVALSGPWFFNMVGLPATFSIFSFSQLHQTEWLVFVAVLIVIFIGAFYPARMISSFNPSLVLKGRFTGSLKGITLRKALVVFQFACSIGLMVGVYIMHDQFRFMQNQDLGLNISNTLVVKAPSNIADESGYQSIPRFRKKMEDMSFVSSVTTSSAIPGQKIKWTGNVRKAPNGSIAGRNFSIQIADPDFILGYNLKIIAGSNFSESDFPKSRSFGSKVENVMLNMEAVHQLGFSSPEEVVDKAIYWDEMKCIVVGVVANYHQESLKSAIQPTLLTANLGSNMSIKLSSAVTKDRLPHILSLIQMNWNSFFPDSPFEYFFLDDFFQRQYSEDEQIMHVFEVFCCLGILVSCLGLFGLSLFTVKQRTKEMAVRKVLGANVLDIIALLTREFLRPVFISCCIALPVAYYVTQQWLTGFAFHISLNGWQFAMPVALVIALALLTVSLQTRQAAIVNPADSLKHE